MKIPVVTLLSGGQDSTTALFWALCAYPADQARHVALSFDYGQAHVCELESAAKVAKRAGVEHLIVDLRAAFATTIGVESALLSSEGSVRLHAPLLALSKAATVQLAKELGPDCCAALAHTWTCYRPQPNGRPCRVCPACVLRMQGFAEAGVADPAET